VHTVSSDILTFPLYPRCGTGITLKGTSADDMEERADMAQPRDAGSMEMEPRTTSRAGFRREIGTGWNGVRTLSARAVLFFAALLLAAAEPGFGAAPWQWITTLSGEGSGFPLHMPSALYVDETGGRYYVVDAGNNRLLSFDREGNFISALNAGGQLKVPFDMVKDGSGRIWVLEKGRNTLTLIDLQNQTTTPHTVNDGNRVVFPDRLEWENDSFYILDKATGEVLALDSGLRVQERFLCRDCAAGFVDFKIRNGALWGLERGGKNVVRFSMDGTVLSKTALDRAVQFPYSLEIGPSQMFYLLDRHEGNVAVFDQQGHFKYRFLEPGQSRGKIYFPIELTFDPWDRLCVVEEGNGRVEIFGR